MPRQELFGAASLKRLSDGAEEIGWEMDTLRRRLQLISQSGDHEKVHDIFQYFDDAIQALEAAAGLLADTAHDLTGRID